MSYFVAQKSMRALKHLGILSGRVLFKVLGDKVLFESLVVDYSKGSLMIDSSLGLSVLFFWYASTPLSKGAIIFLLKPMFCFILYLQKDVHT